MKETKIQQVYIHTYACYYYMYQALGYRVSERSTGTPERVSSTRGLFALVPVPEHSFWLILNYISKCTLSQLLVLAY